MHVIPLAFSCKENQQTRPEQAQDRETSSERSDRLSRLQVTPEKVLPQTQATLMLLSAYIHLLRCSKRIPSELANALAGKRLLASAAEGKGAARWYKDVKVVPNVTEVCILWPH